MATESTLWMEFHQLTRSTIDESSFLVGELFRLGWCVFDRAFALGAAL